MGSSTVWPSQLCSLFLPFPDGPNLNPDRTVLQNVVYELEQMERLPDIQDPFDGGLITLTW